MKWKFPGWAGKDRAQASDEEGDLALLDVCGSSDQIAVMGSGDKRPPPVEQNFFQYLLNVGETQQSYLSWVPSDVVFKKGLPPGGVIAVLIDRSGPISLANVRGNSEFVPFIQQCMPTIISSETTIRTVSARIDRGRLAIPDQRAFQIWATDPRRIALPSWAIIGWVEVREKVANPETYQANPAYRAVAAPGGIASVPKEFFPSLIANLYK